MRRSTGEPYDVVIDTSTLFSALYNRKGNEAFLFELADIGMGRIHLLDYVLDELTIVLARKGMAMDQVKDLLGAYDNLFVHEMEDLGEEEVQLAWEHVSHVEDRPVFLFARRMMRGEKNVFFISGDKGFFRPAVVRLLDGRVMRTRAFIEMVSRGLSN